MAVLLLKQILNLQRLSPSLQLKQRSAVHCRNLAPCGAQAWEPPRPARLFKAEDYAESRCSTFCHLLKSKLLNSIKEHRLKLFNSVTVLLKVVSQYELIRVGVNTYLCTIA